MSELIRANLDQPALITVERNGQRVDLKPVNTVITGVPDKWDPSKRVAAGFFGVEPVVEAGARWPDRRARRHVEDDRADRAYALVGFPVEGLLHRRTT